MQGHEGELRVNFKIIHFCSNFISFTPKCASGPPPLFASFSSNQPEIQIPTAFKAQTECWHISCTFGYCLKKGFSINSQMLIL